MYKYKFNLNTYAYPPENSSTISELESIGKERLELYKIFVAAKNLEIRPNTKKWESYLKTQINIKKLHTYNILLGKEKCIGTLKARRCDHIAHWLMMLCYCKTDELRHHFMNWELQWFMLLYKCTNRSVFMEFLKTSGFIFTSIMDEEKELLKVDLISCRNISDPFDIIKYYKINFTEIINLVGSRKVYLHKGFAYFPETDIIYCVKSKLWYQFLKQLLWTNKIMSPLNDNRVSYLLNDIQPFIPKKGKWDLNDIDLENIDEIAKLHYPLCMQSLHNKLREDHHLKYDCKMQYGVFLKWLGLSYEKAMEFWKNEFTQKMTDDWYNRKYSYLFKHQYGMVGGRIQYQPYTCEQILSKYTGPGQHHGCPFKHWDKDKLLEKFHEDGLKLSYIADIDELINKKKYREACTKYFSVFRNYIREDIIQSPNEYCADSFQIEEYLQSYMDSIFEEL